MWWDDLNEKTSPFVLVRFFSYMLVQARAGPCLLVTLFFLSAPAADRFFFFFFSGVSVASTSLVVVWDGVTCLLGRLPLVKQTMHYVLEAHGWRFMDRIMHRMKYISSG